MTWTLARRPWTPRIVPMAVSSASGPQADVVAAVARVVVVARLCRPAGLSTANRNDRLLGPEIESSSAVVFLFDGFPKLQGVKEASARELYLSSYIQTYVERDVRELLRIDKRREFEVFLKMCALRTGQVVNHEDLGRDAGISSVTSKGWLSLLEESFLIRLVPPYHTNRTKRLIKSPKLYFLDMGLAAHLAGWRDPEALRLGPMGGAAFETHIFGQLLRRFRHRLREAEFSFWRTRDGQEIDMLVELEGRCHPVEVKMGRPRPQDLAPLRRIAQRHWAAGQVVSLSGGAERFPAAEGWDLVSPTGLSFERAEA